MELRDYLRIMRKGWPLILAFVVFGSALGVGLTVFTTKIYQASVQIFVATAVGDDPSQLASGNTFSQAQVQSYISIANAPSVTDPVIQKLKLNITSQELADKITADAPATKVLINLQVTDHDPRTAADLANALAAQFNIVVAQTAETSGKAVVKLTVIHPATEPTSPIKPSPLINVGLGFVIGLLLGLGLVVLRDVLDNTVKGPGDFEPLGVPVLGYVPFDKRTAKMPIAFRGDLHSGRSEAYRQLRTNMQFVDIDNPPRIIAVTSPMPGDGKSTTAVNLAAALAEAGFRVCLIEADLRRPSLAKSLGLIGDVGLTTVLIGQAPIDSVLQNAGRNLAVMTSGPVPPNPSELLISENARRVIAEIASGVDYTIIDTAPLLPVSDGAEIAAIAEATLIVTRAGKTTTEQVERSLATLEKVGKRPVGAIMNMLTRGQGSYEDGYGYYYVGYRPDRSHRAKNGDDIPAVSGPPVADADESAPEEVGARPQADPIIPSDSRP
ncbi:MAG: polysaccharide biosynthesis tyrosine autokinase [Nakamurella sp.]